MSEPLTSTPGPETNPLEATISFDGEGVHVDATISTHRIRRLLNSAVLILTHLVTAGLINVSLNPNLIQPQPYNPDGISINEHCFDQR